MRRSKKLEWILIGIYWLTFPFVPSPTTYLIWRYDSHPRWILVWLLLASVLNGLVTMTYSFLMMRTLHRAASATWKDYFCFGIMFFVGFVPLGFMLGFLIFAIAWIVKFGDIPFPR
jgi:hypothetical protein